MYLQCSRFVLYYMQCKMIFFIYNARIIFWNISSDFSHFSKFKRKSILKYIFKKLIAHWSFYLNIINIIIFIQKKLFMGSKNNWMIIFLYAKKIFSSNWYKKMLRTLIWNIKVITINYHKLLKILSLFILLVLLTLFTDICIIMKFIWEVKP